MESNLTILNNKIKDYLLEHISKTEFADWAEDIYIDIIKGGFLEINKLILYPFVKTFSNISVAENDIEDVFPCSLKDVKEIQKIVQGDLDTTFYIKVRIPVNMISFYNIGLYFDVDKIELVSKLKEQLLLFIDYQEISVIDSDLLKRIINTFNNNGTLIGLLENDIIDLIDSIFCIDNDVISIRNTMALYSKLSGHNTLLNHLLLYLDCYLGNESFFVLISLKKGLPKLKLII